MIQGGTFIPPDRKLIPDISFAYSVLTLKKFEYLRFTDLKPLKIGEQQLPDASKSWFCRGRSRDQQAPVAAVQLLKVADAVIHRSIKLVVYIALLLLRLIVKAPGIDRSRDLKVSVFHSFSALCPPDIALS